MIKHERWTFVVFGEKEDFDFYLSAFLNAGMSVRGAFHVEQDPKLNELVKKWKELWETRLTREQRCLWDFMREDRKHEVHRSGSSRRPGTENIDLAETHRLKFGATVTYNIQPGLLRMQLPTYYFTIDGTERKVTEACGE